MKIKKSERIYILTPAEIAGAIKVMPTENIYQEIEIESLRSRRRLRKLNLFHIGAI